MKITSMVKSQGSIIHITPLYNLENILKNGLIPLSNDEIFNYPNGVFTVNKIPSNCIMSVLNYDFKTNQILK